METTVPASRKRSYARYTLAATELLGALVAMERKTRRMSVLELAERLGVDRGTLSRLERGDPKVELGVAFEACALLGVPLFNEDAQGITSRLAEINSRLALLPARARAKRVSISDDF